MRPFHAIVRTRAVQAAVIAALVVLLAIFTWITPPHAEVLHNVLHHLNILPFMLAGLIFGWRGALGTLLFATVLQAPSIHRHWYVAPLDAQDQLVELSIFGAAGVIAGMLADRERMQRRRVEATQQELERVHLELRENVEHLRKTERLTAAGRLSASLAHEIRNPLASISGAAGVLARGQAPAESRTECLEILIKESQRLNKLLTNFLTFARPRLPRLQWVEASVWTSSIATLAQHTVPDRTVKVEHGQNLSHFELHCDPEQLRQVMLNLLLNALQASGKEGEVILRSAVTAHRFSMEVQDNGPGVSAEDLDRIFDPFFTTKENGTGLGLAIAGNIVSQHGGTLECRRRTGTSGMIFRMELACRRATTEPASHKDHALVITG